MQEELNLKISGHLFIQDDKGDVLYDDHNALTLNANNVVRRALASEPAINRMVAYYQGNEVGRTTVAGVLYPAADQVTFQASFSKELFNSNIDRISLNSNTSGEFSEVTGLTLVKDGDTKMSIDWTITIKT